MNFLKREFDKFTEEHGTWRLIGHTVMKNRCICYNGNEANPKCPYCFGLGWKYYWYLTKARRSQHGDSLSSSTDKVELDLPFKINTLNLKYYFKTECNINIFDFILEFMEPDDRSKYSLYLVTNDKPEQGEYGEPAYKTILANKVFVSEDHIYKALEKIDIKNLEKV